MTNPAELEILGDGKQTKSYLEVHECIAAMLYATGKARGTVNTFNIGSEDWIDVKTIAEIVTEEMHLPDTKFRFTGGERGWVGDVPRCSSPLNDQGAPLETATGITGKCQDRCQGPAVRTVRDSMKYIVVLGDGMADEPLEELGGKTPLEYAQTPNMDRMARDGACGMLRTIPDGFEAGSDIANMAVLGYAPEKYYTGRGPLEALSMGVDLAPDDVAYRCNLVTIEENTMADFSAGHITSAEGAELFASLQKAVPEVMLKAGVSYRNLLVVHGGQGCSIHPSARYCGAGDIPLPPQGWRCRPASPVHGNRAGRSLITIPVNAARIKAGKRPATRIWPWSGGHKPAFPLFEEKYGKKGGIISAVDLLNGIARCAGMEVITVPGATGYLDTDYDAKARYALDAIKRLDFVYVHIEAPDEAGHLGSVEEKVKAIERVDGVVGTIRDQFDGVLAVLPDHPTPIRVKTHTRDPDPLCCHRQGNGREHGIFGSGGPVRGTRDEKRNGVLGVPLLVRKGWHQSPASS